MVTLAYSVYMYSFIMHTIRQELTSGKETTFGD